MQKFILFSFVVFFIFSSVCFGMDEREEWKHSISLVPVGEPIPEKILMKFGRPGGKSPQSHISHLYPDKENPLFPSTRGKTFYIYATSSRFFKDHTP
ncbi:MAG: hypothetical protein K2W92_06835 [Alphaproteobacteria bacterium]|nr:hypothetical protein [Alphaproteobacteria bacterium]